ncbi:MAG: stage II sporulation protein R [Clostridiaceae bacterium]|jgi:stage II sporulation protein R|nr:stage II sporulation protein R [Clostridiaceae bacterium]
MKTVFSFHTIKDTGGIKWIAAIVASILFFLSLVCLYAESINKDLSDSMIRLHIVANSDEEYDQMLKLKVRDAIISFMNEKMREIDTKEKAKDYLSNNKEKIESVANEVLLSECFQKTATVSFGSFPFPTKKYGNMILPAGYYEALKIEIGEAKGQNWWCVMFPPLCFVEDTKGEIEEEYIDLLRNELNEEEMGIISLTGSDSEIPVEIKFKVVEIFQESKIKLANLFRGILDLK